jgi:DtxR family Mn-dependent transcriptional regulator
MPKLVTRSTESTDNYLKAVYELTAVHERATTMEISKRLNVSAASVTGMLKKLASSSPSLITYRKHFGAELTEAGYRRAVEVIRHHRLIETYLHDALGYGWEEVHAEAEKLEHFISEDLEDRMAAKLDYPEYDPHGHPIPRRDGTIPPCDDLPLRQVHPGSLVRVNRVDDEHSGTLCLLRNLQIRLYDELEVLPSTSPDGSMRLRRRNHPAFALDSLAASRIRVTITTDGASASQNPELSNA